MNPIKTAGLICCSDGISPEQAENTQRLIRTLDHCGIKAIPGPYLYQTDSVFSGTARERADQFMRFWKDDTVNAVFDISGGDLANEILSKLPFEEIRSVSKELWGYSDLTCVLNALYQLSGRTGVLYTVNNLMRSDADRQQALFTAYNSGKSDELFTLPCRFLRGETMEGILVGGNIRCFLKLAGTPSFPDLSGKLLLLEALGSSPARMTALLSQLEQLGAFEKVRGILLGTFTQMEQQGDWPTMEELVLERIPKNLPLAKTDLLGHGANSRAAHIGAFYRVENGRAVPAVPTLL